MDKDNLLRILDISFEDLLTSSQGLGEEEATTVWCGDWSLKEIFAHLTGWNKEMTCALKRLERGERATSDGKDYSDTEYWNRQFTKAYHNTDFAALIEELKSSQQSLKEIANALPEERFYKGRAGYRVICNAGIAHHNEHSREIRAWRQQRGNI